MSLFHLQLLKIPGTYKAEDGLLDTPRAYIVLKSYSTQKVHKEEYKAISHECRTITEAEAAVDCLIKELKAIKKQAAQYFQKQEEKNRRERK